MGRPRRPRQPAPAPTSRWAPPKLVQYVIERWAHGASWLAGLDDQVATVTQQLGLADRQVHPESNRTLVLRARLGREEVAVKFDPDPLAADAADAMDVWAALGAAPPMRARPAPGVDVRAWWPGASFCGPAAGRAAPGEVVAATAELFQLLAAAPPPAIRRTAPEALKALARQADGRIAALPPAGRDALRKLTARRPDSLAAAADSLAVRVAGERLCHGDLAPTNVLRVGGRVALLDPEPYLGSLAADAARWAVRVTLISDAPVEQVVGAAAATAGLDTQLVWELAELQSLTYAVYLLTFLRPIPETLHTVYAASRRYGRARGA